MMKLLLAVENEDVKFVSHLTGYLMEHRHQRDPLRYQQDESTHVLFELTCAYLLQVKPTRGRAAAAAAASLLFCPPVCEDIFAVCLESLRECTKQTDLTPYRALWHPVAVTSVHGLPLHFL